VQSLNKTGTDYVLANRALDAGKRLTKFQVGDGLVLSNHYEWRETHGPLGRNTRLAAVSVQRCSDVTANNNRFKVSNDRNWTAFFALILQGSHQTNIHFAHNDIEINNEVDASHSRLIMRTMDGRKMVVQLI